MNRMRFYLIMGCGLVIAGSSLANGSISIKPSIFERQLQQLRYTGATDMVGAVGTIGGATATASFDDDFEGTGMKRKSPLKAFVLSAAVPGAGQWYNGSRIKPFAFLGAEVAAWYLRLKWLADGDDATDVYEQYNRDHWSQSDYETIYLMLAYGVNDDNDVPPGTTEISHHLPEDPNDQQYFEMTGKYDQFAWGWDDATRHDSTLSMYTDESVKITGPSTTPTTANRLYYEGLRHDANNKYDKGRNMLIVVFVNHLVSGFEAYFSARSQNNNASGTEQLLSRLSLDASLKTYHADRDTPFVKLSLNF